MPCRRTQFVAPGWRSKHAQGVRESGPWFLQPFLLHALYKRFPTVAYEFLPVEWCLIRVSYSVFPISVKVLHNAWFVLINLSSG